MERPNFKIIELDKIYQILRRKKNHQMTKRSKKMKLYLATKKSLERNNNYKV